MEYDPAEVPELIEPIVRGRRRRRLRLASLGRPAAARVPLLAPRRQPLPVAAHERPLQHDALGHGDGLQGVPHRRAALARPARGRLRHRARDHGQVCKQKACGSTSCRSPTTAARTTRARRSPGATASARSGCCSACGSRRDVLEGKTVAVVVPAHDEEALIARRCRDPRLRRPDLRRRRRLERRDRRARARGATIRGSR